MNSPTAKMTSPGSPREEGSLDENLPLYEEFQYSDRPDNAPLPPAKATPAEVVDFLIHLLVSSGSMTVDQARRVAAKWTKGTGQELRSYPPAMFFELFGKEDGWITYREVRMALHKEKNKGVWYRYGVCESIRDKSILIIAGWSTNLFPDIILAALLCFEAIAVSVTFSGVGENVTIVAGIASFVGAMASLLASVGACITLSQNPRKNIEADLRTALNKGVPQQS